MLPVRIKGELKTTCPKRPVFESPLWFSEVLGYYRHYKNGFLPVHGGVDQQPYKLMVILALIDDIKDSVQEQAPKEESRPKGNPFAEQMKG